MLNWESAANVLAGNISGLMFGLGLEKSSVVMPGVIRGQFRLKSFVMVKVFLSTIIVSTLSFIVMNWFGLAKFQPKPTLPYANTIGGLILGIGMFLAGSCPGVVFVQLGSLRLGAIFTLLGGLFGTATYAHYHERLTKTFLFDGKSEGQTLHELLKVDYTILAFGLVVALSILLFIVSKFSRETYKDEKDPFLLRRIWPPFFCGALIGLGQIAPMILSGAVLGTSTGYVSIVGYLFSWFGISNSYVDKFPFPNWQCYFYISIMFGAFLSTRLTFEKRSYSVPAKLYMFYYFVGGFLMLFGARLADGCTSGHGISGTTQLAISSLIAVPSMFAGGFLAAFLLPFV